MKDFCQRLESLVLKYARFNGNVYESQRELSFADKQDIENKLSSIFSNYLTRKGVDDVCIDESLRELEVLLGDKILKNEISWLNGVLLKWESEELDSDLSLRSSTVSQEAHLHSLSFWDNAAHFRAMPLASSSSQEDSLTARQESPLVLSSAHVGLKSSLGYESKEGLSCLGLLKYCREALRKKSEKAQTDYDEVKDLQSFNRVLHKKRLEAVTRTQAALIDSIITLVNFCMDYNKFSGKSKLKGACLYTLPSISSGCFLSLYVQEIAVLYLLLLTIHQGGLWLEGRESRFCQDMGLGIRGISQTLGYASSSFFVSVVNINFNAFYALYSKVRTGYTYFFSPGMEIKEESPHGRKFYNYPALRVIDLILTAYIEGQKQQWGSKLRTGALKSYYIRNALNQLQVIDSQVSNQEEALSQCLLVLEELEKNSVVNASGGQAKATLTKVREFCQTLKMDGAVLGCEEELPSMDVKDDDGSKPCGLYG